MPVQARLKRLTYGGDTTTMSFKSRQVTSFGPSPVAIHDDGNVAGQTVRDWF
jgi:hypothetical protein